MLLTLLACGFPGRIEKALVAPDYVTPVAPTGEVAVVTYATGASGDTPAAYAPPTLTIAGRPFTGVIVLDRDRELLFGRVAALLGVRAVRAGDGWTLTEGDTR